MIAQELIKRNLPDLFVVDGKEIKTKEDWEQIGRPHWKKVMLEEEYGRIPEMVEPTVESKINKINFAGKAVWEEVSFTFEHNGKSHTVPTNLIYPKDKENIPFFVYLNFRPDIPDRYLPVEEMLDNGFGIFSVCYHDITRDNRDFSDGLAGLFTDGERSGNDSGKIMYWAYMASRMMDYLQTRPEVRKDAVAVAGHSRLGKTALLTGALDERFAFVFSNDSGCSGAALSHHHCEGSERLNYILRCVGYWFCPNYYAYDGKDDETPFDQHCLLSLIAPRFVHVGAAIEDVWADTDNQFLNCVASSKVWELYGKKGFICPDRMPLCGDKFTEGEVGFHLRAGKHFHSRTDWLVYWEDVKNRI